MADKEEAGQQVLDALTKKLEKRFHRETRIRGAGANPWMILQDLVEQEARNLEEQEEKNRDSGHTEVADVFETVRKKLLKDVHRELMDRLAS